MRTVYDTYHPIVDHSNLLIIGITAAMAWELPSKPVDLNEHLQGSYEMQDLQRNDKNVTDATPPQYASTANSNNVNRIDSNSYYTNIPKHKIFYEKKNQYQSPYKSYEKYKYKSSIPSDSLLKPAVSSSSSSNKLTNYVMYADSLMKQFKKLTETIPPNRPPFSPVNFQEFANM